MMLPLKKAIIPVAGYGTRFLPVTKAMPKEMLPIVDKPIIQYLVEEAVSAGITDIIFITGRGKRAIEDHFDVSYELEQTLVERDKHELLDIVKPLTSLARFIYIRQPIPLGHGDAILRASHLLAKGEPFAVLFGDDLVDSRIPALQQLIDVFTTYQKPVVALARVSRRDLGRYGAVEGNMVAKRVWEIQRFIEKPQPEQTIRIPHAAFGRYVLTADIFDTLLRIQKQRAGASEKTAATKIGKHRELGIFDGIIDWLRHDTMYGVEIDGDWYDCGNRLGYLKANVAYALKRPELRKQLMPFLKKIR